MEFYAILKELAPYAVVLIWFLDRIALRNDRRHNEKREDIKVQKTSDTAQDRQIAQISKDVKEIRDTTNFLVKNAKETTEGIVTIVEFLEPDINGSGDKVVKRLRKLWSDKAKESLILEN